MTIASVPVPAPAPEQKSVSDAAASTGSFMGAFESYKETNDRRLAEIEKRGAEDPLTTDKLARIDRVLDDLTRKYDGIALREARPGLGVERPNLSPRGAEHKQAFEAYVRSGAEQDLRRLEEKALSVGSNPDGGYLVPPELEREVMRRMTQISPIRAIAGNRQISAMTYNKPFSATGPAVGWVAETGARTETASPPLSLMSFPTMELYAMPSASGALLDDAAIDIGTWLAEEIDTAFAEQEGAAFVTGDGVNKPKGFLAYDKVAAASWSWGNLGYVATGAAGAFPSSNPSDKLIDFVYTLKAGYRQNASWVMSRKTQSEIRKFKDTTGAYLWSPPATPGAPATLMNFPVVEAEDMPAIAADSYAIAFGDFRRGYLVVDRIGMRMLRDPYSAKPYTLFYTTKRVGGGVQDFDAIKLMKFGAS
jgi:HK97 family phage major capsid protein